MEGTCRRNRQAVLLAAFDIAERVGKVQFDASVRVLADAANVSDMAANRAMHRLDDWLQIVTRGAGTRGSTVRLRGRQRYPLCPSKRQGLVGTVQCLTHDLWRHDGLGKSTGRVYELLTAEPASAEEIGSRLGVKRRAATVHLTKLKRRELADYVTDGWVRGPADPDLLAVEFGAAGTADRQRQRHRERVALRREYLTRHSAVRREEGRWAWWQTWWESLQSEVAVSRAW